MGRIELEGREKGVLICYYSSNYGQRVHDPRGTAEKEHRRGTAGEKLSTDGAQQRRERAPPGHSRKNAFGKRPEKTERSERFPARWFSYNLSLADLPKK